MFDAAQQAESLVIELGGLDGLLQILLEYFDEGMGDQEYCMRVFHNRASMYQYLVLSIRRAIDAQRQDAQALTDALYAAARAEKENIA